MLVSQYAMKPTIYQPKNEQWFQLRGIHWSKTGATDNIVLLENQDKNVVKIQSIGVFSAILRGKIIDKKLMSNKIMITKIFLLL